MTFVYTTLSDRQLVNAAIGNDPRAVDELLRRFRGLIRYIGRQNCGLEGQDLEELEQIIFLKLMKDSAKGLRACRGSAFRHYVAAVARNAAIDLVRSKSAGDAAGDNEEAEDAPYLDEPPYRNAHVRELEAAIGEFLSQLRPKARQAFFMSYKLGSSQKDIAHHLGLSQVNAGVIVYRSRKALAVYLENRFGKRCF